jgi:hypothetical protein
MDASSIPGGGRLAARRTGPAGSHSKMSTTLRDLHPTDSREAVLMANDGKLEQNPEGLPLASQQIQ